MNIDEKYGLCQYKMERIKQSLSLVYLILINWFKGTVRVISSDPTSKDCNVRFTIVSLQVLSDRKLIRW